MENQRIDMIVGIVEEIYFTEVDIPEEILSDKEGQFISDRWFN